MSIRSVGGDLGEYKDPTPQISEREKLQNSYSKWFVLSVLLAAVAIGCFASIGMNLDPSNLTTIASVGSVSALCFIPCGMKTYNCAKNLFAFEEQERQSLITA